MGNVRVHNLPNTYTYDAEGRPITAAGVQTTFDAFERAVEQNNSGNYTQIVYSPTSAKFAYMNGLTLNRYMAPMVAGMAAVHTSTTGYFQHADWLGSSRFAATGSGDRWPMTGPMRPSGKSMLRPQPRIATSPGRRRTRRQVCTIF